MCTVVIEVPAQPDLPTRVLAIRDEDPDRAWDPPGIWWPELFPGTLGVRDRRANGAWLAFRPDQGRFAVILNRGEEVPTPVEQRTSRGARVLSSVESRSASGGAALPTTAAFNLVEIAGSAAKITTWDGEVVREKQLEPGVHMIAHHDVNDARSPRIVRWLPEFRALADAVGQDWRRQWLHVLELSAELGPNDDRAIIRDNHAHGFPTLSLLACIAEVSVDSVELEWAALARPGTWGHPEFRPALPAHTQESVIRGVFARNTPPN